MEKAAALWQSMNEATGEEQPFPADEIEDAMSLLREQMEAEDPNATVFCNCHGIPWASKEVDFWGLCPDSRGEEYHD